MEANVFFLATPFYQIRRKKYQRYTPCGVLHNRGSWTAMFDWLGKQPAFIRSSGKDHFVFLPGPYIFSRKGAPFVGRGLWADHPVHDMLMQNVIKATHEGIIPAERAVAMPYGTFIHTHRNLDLPATLDRIFNKNRQHSIAYIGGMWRGRVRSGRFPKKFANWEIKRKDGVS